MSTEQTPPSAPTELAKAYDPSTIEEKWANYWVAERLFDTPAPIPGTKAFTTLLPPPNVTGRLHMGHMLNQAEMDILTRWHRMSGSTALWVPGTDHAGIATQMMVEKQLLAEGTSRSELGREAFIARVWEWKQKYGSAITDQMRRLGASVDWSREYFTMDDDLSLAVNEAFVRLYEQGLIYRGAYIVNWDPVLQTAVSDLEVESEERIGKLYYIRYPLADNSGEYITIATTRPETMLADQAVAVNPNDERYKHLVGRELQLPLTQRTIPVIADDWANPEFGTGAVKVTPAHDPNDFAIGQRHGLMNLSIMDKTGRMDVPGTFVHGKDRFEARELIVAQLKSIGLLVEVKEHPMTIPISQRSGAVIEPRLSDQWFLAVNKAPLSGGESIAAKAIAAVKEGHIKFTPSMYEKTYQQWMENIHDWCLSRQLWWGHRIPAWHCDACKAITVARTAPTVCTNCNNSTELRQDPDVLDTWFSSGMLPFTVFGWPNLSPANNGLSSRSAAEGSAVAFPSPTPDLAAFYPTDLLVTGFDILFFWVARMIMLGTHFMQAVPNSDGSERALADSVPFRNVYIHALVRDADRQKMSKTKGNVIDPIEIITRYGTDAVRFTLASQASPGTDIAFNEERTQGYRAFANKIWNAARFLFLNIDRAKEIDLLINFNEIGEPYHHVSKTSPVEARWIVGRFSATVARVGKLLEEYRFDLAANSIYQFFWNDFCDWYLEIVKLRLNFAADADQTATKESLTIFASVFEGVLRLLSPFMPFLTEELWHALYRGKAPQKSIALAAFPTHHGEDLYGQEEWQIIVMQSLVTEIRALRKELGVPERELIEINVYGNPETGIGIMGEIGNRPELIKYLGRVGKIVPVMSPLMGSNVRSAANFDLQILYERQIDIPAERERLTKDLAKYEKGLQAADKQLTNDSFTSRAPAHIIDGLRKQSTETRVLYDKTKAALDALPAG